MPKNGRVSTILQAFATRSEKQSHEHLLQPLSLTRKESLIYIPIYIYLYNLT